MSPNVDPDVRQARARLRIVAAGFAIALLGLGARLVDLALPEAGQPVAAAPAPAVPSHRRADIVDRNGVLLATDYPKASVFVDPAEVIDPAASARQLSRALHVDEAALRARLSTERRFIWLKRHVTDAELLELFRAEADDYRAAAAEYRRLGQTDAADDMDVKAGVVERYLS